MARCSRLFIFNFKEKFCVSARIGKKFVLKILSKKLYLRFYLTHIVHSNGEILFPWWKNFYRSFFDINIISKALLRSS